MINIYVGNLPFTTTDEELSEAFSAHGKVLRATVIMDRQSGRSRGFGFVEMDREEDGRKAIDSLNGSSMGGRTLVVNEARGKGM